LSFPPILIDVVLLCTDGLSNVVSDAQLALVLAGETDVEATAAALMGIAAARAASDDVTCVVLRWAIGKQQPGRR
jgi:protein phosphatase